MHSTKQIKSLELKSKYLKKYKHGMFEKPKNVLPLILSNNNEKEGKTSIQSNSRIYWQWSSNPLFFVETRNLTLNDDASVQATFVSNVDTNAMDRIVNMTGVSMHQNAGFIKLIIDNNEVEYLGVGHYHYDIYKLMGLSDEYNFGLHGSHYAHYFFTINDKAPFYIKRISKDFCFTTPYSMGEFNIEVSRNENKINRHYGLKRETTNVTLQSTCDVIQFVTGLTQVSIDNNDFVMVSYGVNDCFGTLALVSKQEILDMLQLVSYDR